MQSLSSQFNSSSSSGDVWSASPRLCHSPPLYIPLTEQIDAWLETLCAIASCVQLLVLSFVHVILHSRKNHSVMSTASSKSFALLSGMNFFTFCPLNVGKHFASMQEATSWTFSTNHEQSNGINYFFPKNTCALLMDSLSISTTTNFHNNYHGTDTKMYDKHPSTCALDGNWTKRTTRTALHFCFLGHKYLCRFTAENKSQQLHVSCKITCTQKISSKVETSLKIFTLLCQPNRAQQKKDRDSKTSVSESREIVFMSFRIKTTSCKEENSRTCNTVFCELQMKFK